MRKGYRPFLIIRSYYDNISNGDKEEEDDKDDDEIELNVEQTEANFPRLGWSPGSFGARALRPSVKRKPGQAVGRTGKFAPSEDEEWFKAGLYEEYSKKLEKVRKRGVASDGEMADFFANNSKSDIIVIDARNTDFEIEPGDEKHAGNIAENDHGKIRGPRALNLPYCRKKKLNLNIEKLEALLTKGKDTPIITHCGGGGRGQKTKVYLESLGYSNVLNGGGPNVPEHWEYFVSL